MNSSLLRIVFPLLLAALFMGCANIVPPSGGTKDTSPPKLLSVSPKDSVLNTRVSKIEMRFDEYVAVNDVIHEVQIAPLLPVPLNVEAISKRVIIKIPDSLLMENTTYRISFGKAIRDIHEENQFTGYSYIFSTGGYFDSMNLEGVVFDAFTGQRDTGATVVLYPGNRSDSVVVREKPLYAVKADAAGNFLFKGLPDKSFRIFALKDPNGNLMYDGGAEAVAFHDSLVRPYEHSGPPVRLNLFREVDSSGTASQARQARGKPGEVALPDAEKETANSFGYFLNLDTVDLRKRTFDFTGSLEVIFNKKPFKFNQGRVHLSSDSAGITVEQPFALTSDTVRTNVLRLKADWAQNTVYTLRLLKGFAQDSAGTDAMPSKYSFRTKRDEDYAKLHIHLPSRYYGHGYLLVVLRDNDTVLHSPVKDTIVHLLHLGPGAYTIKVVADRNGNGKWDTGDLFAGTQPEEIIPYSAVINLKPGWENMIDFEEVKTPKPGKQPSLRTRDTPRKE